MKDGLYREDYLILVCLLVEEDLLCVLDICCLDLDLVYRYLEVRGLVCCLKELCLDVLLLGETSPDSPYPE